MEKWWGETLSWGLLKFAGDFKSSFICDNYKNWEKEEQYLMMSFVRDAPMLEFV